MYSIYLDIRDYIINRLICFLLNHCDLHTSTIRQVIKKTSYGELEAFNNDRIVKSA